MASISRPTRAVNRVYRPILRARRGELLALQHLDPALVPLITPILVLEPTGRGPVIDAYDLVSGLRERAPDGLHVGIDLAAVPDVEQDPSAPYDLGEGLADRGVPILPVIRLTDSDRRLAAHGAAARLHLDRAVIRLSPPADPTHSAAAAAACERVWRCAGLDADQCDLLIDLAEVRCAADITWAEQLVRRVGSWVWHYPWASVTLAAGAMPPTVSHLPANTPSPLWRWDEVLWRRFADTGVGYGDYGIACPSPGIGGERPVPTMRYTAGDAWWIYRWSRRGGRGDEHFYDLCRALVTSEHWPTAGASFSWGDREIARRARHKPGPGTSTSWVAWGTSHHLAHVVTTLARHGRRNTGGTPIDSAPGPDRSLRTRRTD